MRPLACRWAGGTYRRAGLCYLQSHHNFERAMPTIKLAPELEKALLHGIISGTCAPELIKQDELSKKGKAIYGAIDALFRKGAKAPLKRHAIALAATHLCGMEKESTNSYLSSLAAFDAGAEAGTVLRAARDKALLVNLVNRAGEQLASGDLRVSDLTGLLTERETTSAPSKSLASQLGKRWPKPPRGVAIPSLPMISEITKGILGIWVIAGEPGMGKSTLTWQIALDLQGPEYDVLYYDLDATGLPFFIDRTRSIVGSDMLKFKRRTRHIYFRPSIMTLEEDLQRHPPPALLIIDSPQTLPVGVRFAKESLDNWIRRFKELVSRGYAVLMTSEKARSQYGEASMSGFKGTGDIEYGATVGAHMLNYEDDPNGPVKFVIVKNRHGGKKGHVADLERDEAKTFWWRETLPYIEEVEEKGPGKKRWNR